jgi:hypothetical protein
MIEPAVNTTKSGMSGAIGYNPQSGGNLSRLIIERPATNKSQASNTSNEEVLVRSEKASQYSIRTGSKEKARKAYNDDDLTNNKVVMTLDEYKLFDSLKNRLESIY